MLLEIMKAQVSNKSADTCADISIGHFLFIIIACIFILSYPFINQRVKQSVSMSDARLYPGLGGVFQKLASQDGSFSVKDDELFFSFNMIERQELNGWIVIFSKEDPKKILENEKTASYQPVIIFAEKELYISQPQHGFKLSSSYKPLGFFSSSEIKKITNNKSEMILYVKAFLNSASNSEVPHAIFTMLLVVALQYLLLVFVIAALLCFSKIKAIPNTRLEKISHLWPSLRIVATISFLPSIVVAIISYFNSSFGMSLGWVIFSLILGVRAIVIYMQRIKSKSVVNL